MEILDGISKSKQTLCFESMGKLQPMIPTKKLWENQIYDGATVFARRKMHAAMAKEYGTIMEVAPPHFIRDTEAAKQTEIFNIMQNQR